MQAISRDHRKQTNTFTVKMWFDYEDGPNFSNIGLSLTRLVHQYDPFVQLDLDPAFSVTAEFLRRAFKPAIELLKVTLPFSLVNSLHAASTYDSALTV